MRQISDRQRRLNKAVSDVKNSKPKTCIICLGFCPDGDAVHLLPRSTFPEYYTARWNIWRGHRGCHQRYDDDKTFRSSLKHIRDIIREQDKQAERRYFNEECDET